MTDSTFPSGSIPSGASTVIPVPRFSVQTFNTFGTDKDFGILCHTLAPAIAPNGEMGAMSAPQVFLNMSIPAAKELSLLLRDFVEAHEKEFGKITSAFINEREAV